MSFEHLFSPVMIGKMELSNRAVMPAMGTGYATAENTVQDRLLAYLERRAQGGPGLIITEICAVDPRGKTIANQLGGWSDEFIPSLSRIPQTLHRYGVKAAIQLHHAGRETHPAVIGGLIPEAPSAIPSVVYRQACEAMSIERIAELVQAFAVAAGRVQNAGFDAVEIHAAHGYLVHQFLSPFTNHRQDAYGGDDERRSRFLLEIIEAVRRRTGPDFSIIVRVSAEEMTPEGFHLDFMRRLAPKLEAAGVDALHASIGAYATPGFLTIASMDTAPGFNLPRARAIKELVRIPVIGVGRIADAKLAEEALVRGDADLIAFGRAMLADPDFVRKSREGRLSEIRPCVACNQGCIEKLTLNGEPITCSFNPECGQEYQGVAKAAASKHVWVIGAGPAGLQAALSAAQRGHRVEIFEQAALPGGQLQPASKPPHKELLTGWLRWILERLDTAGVAVHWGKKIERADLHAVRPEAVILATGAEPCTPDIPGLDCPHVADARVLLTGGKQAASPAVILGAGHVGMETADFLIRRGNSVTILEQLPQPPVTTRTAHGYWLYKRLKSSGGSLVTAASVTGITLEEVRYVQDGKTFGIPADLVVTALGSRSNDMLKTDLDDLGIAYISAGDVLEPRRFLEAIQEGWQAGFKI